MAPVSLMDIVHPAHMSSPIFTRGFAGNCFNCHNVNATGQFEILTQNVEVLPQRTRDNPSALG